MKKSTRILVCGALFAYGLFSYGVISATTSKQKYADAELRCRRMILAPGLSRRVTPVCSPLELTDLRDEGRLLMPFQLAVLAAADDWLSSGYWRRSAFGILLLSAVPKIWENWGMRWLKLIRNIRLPRKQKKWR